MSAERDSLVEGRDRVIACGCGESYPCEHIGPLTMSYEILDACCGGRMWWWDKAHPLAVYMDKREAPRGSVGEVSGRPEWNPSWSCEPDVLADFRSMPFDDASFRLVVFDPPHIVRDKQPPEGINGLKYGALHPDTEQNDLRRGFSECWRVLAHGGTLVFKWAGPLDRVEPHFPASPTVGSRNAPRGSKGLGTRWFVFYKPMLKEPLREALRELCEPTVYEVEELGIHVASTGNRYGLAKQILALLDARDE